MTLEQVNEALLEIDESLAEKLPKLRQAEFQYDKRYFQLILNSGMATALLKESEAKEIIITEGLYEPLIELKGEVRYLFNKKELYIEYSKNLRVIMMGLEK